ncbi:MAG: hypothetical protein OK422_01005 [Thaumarchaeota archaeon]|nr:hypothetical protein [Nitrososphaerota archaeon]
MLFMVDSVHSAETCPAGSIRPDAKFSANLKKAVKRSGVKWVNGYLDAPSHHFYFLVQARTAEQIYEFVVPLLVRIGTTKVSPVLEWHVAVKAGRKAGVQK